MKRKRAGDPEIEVEPSAVVAEVVQPVRGVVPHGPVGGGVVRVREPREDRRHLLVEVQVPGHEAAREQVVRGVPGVRVGAVRDADPAQEQVGREDGDEGGGGEPEFHS